MEKVQSTVFSCLVPSLISPAMFVVLLNSEAVAADITEALASLLTSYGVKGIAKLDHEEGLKYLVDGESAEDEVAIVSAHPELTSLAIRRLTLNSVRLPTRVVVWDGPSQSSLVAARLPWASLRQSLIENEYSLEDAVLALTASIGLTVYTVQQFASTDALRIGGSFSKSGIRQHFYKHASGRGAIKLRDEVNFYQALPATLRGTYPELLFMDEDKESIWMGIEYKGFPNLRDLLLNLQISPAKAVQLLRQVLDYEFRSAYQGHLQPTPANYLHDYHYHRVWRRIQISNELDPNFKNLVSARWLEVNGQRLPNIPAMLLRLERDERAAARLDPGGVSPYIHADLHLENILCDVEGQRFWLVDPRGYPSCDIYYDLGKLAHSYNSNYDLLHEGRHETSFELRDDTAVVDFRFTSKILADTYAELNRRMQPVIHDLILSTKQQLGSTTTTEDIDLRTRFNEAMHFCSDMPFHINPNARPNVAMPIYAIGAQLLAEVLEMLGIDVLSCADLQEEGLARLDAMGKQRWRFEG